MSNHWNRNPFDSILPAEISNVKGVYPTDNLELTLLERKGVELRGE